MKTSLSYIRVSVRGVELCLVEGIFLGGEGMAYFLFRNGLEEGIDELTCKLVNFIIKSF